MPQQAVDLALNLKNILYNNWTLTGALAKTVIIWYAYEPTRAEIREKPISISVTYISGSGTSTCKAVSQIRDQFKIDVYIALRNLEGDAVRATAEANRMLAKDEIMKLIHDNQTSITGMKFGKFIRFARSDEVDSDIKQWYLHEVAFVQAEWYHTES